MSEEAKQPEAAAEPTPVAPPAIPATVDPKSAKVTKTFKADKPLLACRFDPTGQYVFAASELFTINRFKLDDGAHTVFTAHDSWLRGLGFSPDGSVLYSAGYDGRLVFWPAADAEPKPIRIVETQHGWVRGLAVSPDGSMIATGGDDKNVKIWSGVDGSLLHTLEGHENHVYSVRFHPDGRRIFSGSLDGMIYLREIESGSRVAELDAKELYTYDTSFRKQFGGVRNIGLNADATLLAAGGLYQNTNAFAGVHKPRAIVFDLAAGKALRSHHSDPNGIVWDNQWHPDGFLIGGCSGNGGAFLCFWNTEEGPFHTLKLPNMLRGMHMHKDNQTIATAHHDGNVRITTLPPVAVAGQ